MENPTRSIPQPQTDGKISNEIEYINTFTKKEKQAYDIAKEHLGMSFQVNKSIGYRDWLKTKTN